MTTHHPDSGSFSNFTTKLFFIASRSGVTVRTATSYITDLAASGKYHFTTAEAARALGVSLVAARTALRRLAAKQAIASPARGFHVIVPPEYRRLGCLPPEQFIPQLMAARGLPYHVGLLSAAELHGAAHHRPQQFQVMVERPRPSIACGQVRVAFVARRAASRAPIEERNTPRGTVRVSTPEVTALDLVGYPARVGGLDVVTTVVSELVELIDAAKLAEAAALVPVPWTQRLGYVLELVGGEARAAALADVVTRRRPSMPPTSAASRRASRRRRARPTRPRWKNATVAQVALGWLLAQKPWIGGPTGTRERPAGSPGRPQPLSVPCRCQRSGVSLSPESPIRCVALHATVPARCCVLRQMAARLLLEAAGLLGATPTIDGAPNPIG